MNIKPVMTRRIYQEILGSFIDFIANEEIKVGDKLPSERILSDRFQVSRPSVREALRVLQTIGLIDIRAGGGAYLTDFNPGAFLGILAPLFLKRKDFGLELLELRQLFEVRAAELAAGQTGGGNLEKLKTILETMESASKNGDYIRGVETDIAFHTALFAITGNFALIKGSELVNALIEISIKDARKLVLEHAESPMQLYEEHRNIANAIAAKNPKKAGDAMRKHLLMVRSVYEKVLSPLPPKEKG